MPSLIDIRRRIRSVKNTQQITKAMKMVSAAKLRRAQDRTISSRPYAALLRKLLGNLAAAVAAAFKLITPTTTPSPLTLSTAKINAAGLIVVLIFGIGTAASLASCGGAQTKKIEQVAYACATVDVGRTVPEVGMTIFQDVMVIVSAGADGWRDALAAIGVKYGEDSVACAAKAVYDALTAQQSSASARTSAPTPAALRALTYINERSYRYQ